MCSPLQNPTQLEDILQHLCKDPRLSHVTDKILAFRTDLEEGYDDGGFLGAGEKLLHMLERMNVDNIVVMVFFWDYGHMSNAGADLFKKVLDTARGLILSLHSQLF